MATVAIVAIVLAVIAVPVGAHLGVDHRDEVPRAVAVPRQLVPGVLPVALPVVVGGVVSVVVHVGARVQIGLEGAVVVTGIIRR
jgi:hypothetical protein